MAFANEFSSSSQPKAALSTKVIVAISIGAFALLCAGYGLYRWWKHRNRRARVLQRQSILTTASDLPSAALRTSPFPLDMGGCVNAEAAVGKLISMAVSIMYGSGLTPLRRFTELSSTSSHRHRPAPSSSHRGKPPPPLTVTNPDVTDSRECLLSPRRLMDSHAIASTDREPTSGQNIDAETIPQALLEWLLRNIAQRIDRPRDRPASGCAPPQYHHAH